MGHATPGREGNALLMASLALALGGWLALGQDMHGQRPFAARKRRVTTEIALAIASRMPAAQRRIDDVSGVPNLGALVAMLAAPIAMHTNLSLYDVLTGASTARKRWHSTLTVGSVGLISLCWLRGVPRNECLPWQFGGVSLKGGNGWRAATSLSSTAVLSLQAAEGAAASRRAVLHLYATGQERALCIRSSLYGLAQICLGVLTLAVSARPAATLLGRRNWGRFPTPLAQGFLLAVSACLLLGNVAPAWRLGRAGGPSRSRVEQALEQSLRAFYVLSTYRSVRRLALALQGTLLTHPVPVNREETRLLRVRGLGELDLLLQLFKTTINDARLVLLPYVDTRRFDADAARQPDGVAEALLEARANQRQGRMPATAESGANALRDADSFNDERFLAAVWRAYARKDARTGSTLRPWRATTITWSAEALRMEGDYGEE